MPGVPWANKAQLIFLNGKVDEFRSAQRDHTTTKFKKNTYRDFFVRWPDRETELAEIELDPPPPPKKKKNVDTEPVPVPTDKGKWKALRKKQIRNWFNNRGNNTDRNKGPAIVIASEKPTRTPTELHLYSKKFYASKIQPIVAEASAKGIPKAEILPLITKTTFESWLQEPESVRQEISDEVEKMKEEAKKAKLLPTVKEKRTAEEYVAELVKLPSIIRAFTLEMSKRTGYQISVLAGGPDPNKPGAMRTYALHEGQDLYGQLFSVAHDQYYEHVAKPFVSFLEGSYTIDDINAYLSPDKKITSVVRSGPTPAVADALLSQSSQGPSTGNGTGISTTDPPVAEKIPNSLAHFPDRQRFDTSATAPTDAEDDGNPDERMTEVERFDPFNPDDPMFSLLDELNCGNTFNMSQTPRPLDGSQEWFGGVAPGYDSSWRFPNTYPTVMNGGLPPLPPFNLEGQGWEISMLDGVNVPVPATPSTPATSTAINPVNPPPAVPLPTPGALTAKPSTPATPESTSDGGQEQSILTVHGPLANQAHAPAATASTPATSTAINPVNSPPAVPLPTPGALTAKPSTPATSGSTSDGGQAQSILTVHGPLANQAEQGRKRVPASKPGPDGSENVLLDGDKGERGERATRSRKPTTSKEIACTMSWLESTREYLEKDIVEKRWRECVHLWYEFEKKEASEQDTTSLRLPKTYRPDVLKKWLSTRNYSSSPAISDLNKFALEWLAWWNDLQPTWRKPEHENSLPLSHDVATPNDNLHELRKGGPSGIMSVLVGLKWWAGLEKEDAAVSWQEAVEDVLKCFTFQPPANNPSSVEVQVSSKGKRKYAGNGGPKKRATKKRKDSK